MFHENEKICKSKKQCVRGFTLLELVIVMALMAGILAIGIAGLRSLTNVDIKKEITNIAGLISETYMFAAVSGKTHRIVFDLDQNTFWVEIKSGEPEEVLPELGYEEVFSDEKEKLADDKEPIRPLFKKLEGALGKPTALNGNLKFLGIWTEHLSEVARSGKTTMYFFPDGFTELSYICVSEKSDESNSLYVSAQPLTGVISTGAGEPTLEEIKNGKAFR